MHELSIAMSLVDLCADAIEREGAPGPVESVHIRVGALSGVVVEALEFSWDVAIARTVCAGARLVVERVPGRIRCPACEAETELEDPPRFVCAACGTPSGHLVAGKELDLVALELDDRPKDAQPETTPEAAHP